MAGKRPDWVKAPDHLSESPPVPKPDDVPMGKEHGAKDRLEPTRYGDWEGKGICWDF